MLLIERSYCYIKNAPDFVRLIGVRFTTITAYWIDETEAPIIELCFHLLEFKFKCLSHLLITWVVIDFTMNIYVGLIIHFFLPLSSMFSCSACSMLILIRQILFRALYLCSCNQPFAWTFVAMNIQPVLCNWLIQSQGNNKLKPNFRFSCNRFGLLLHSQCFIITLIIMEI